MLPRFFALNSLGSAEYATKDKSGSCGWDRTEPGSLPVLPLLVRNAGPLGPQRLGHAEYVSPHTQAYTFWTALPGSYGVTRANYES